MTLTAYPYPWNANDEMYGPLVAFCHICGKTVRTKLGTVGIDENSDGHWYHTTCWNEWLKEPT